MKKVTVKEKQTFKPIPKVKILGVKSKLEIKK